MRRSVSAENLIGLLGRLETLLAAAERQSDRSTIGPAAWARASLEGQQFILRLVSGEIRTLLGVGILGAGSKTVTDPAPAKGRGRRNLRPPSAPEVRT
jgi:hypothetical protein